jgi:hypothetical protein
MRDIVVSDLDDTLVASNGDPIVGVLSELLEKQSEGYAVVIVSGRQLDRFDETKQWLSDNGLNVADADIHLSDFPPGPNASREFKLYKAQLLLDAGDVIDEWFENDPDTIIALQDLGIEVKDAAAYRATRVTDAPTYMRRAAEVGLKYFAEGKAGDGLQPATVREARAMARGQVSDDKWVRVAAWVARHRGDWEGVPQNSDPSRDDFPGAGAVAAYLWGVDPTINGQADKVISFAQRAIGSNVDARALDIVCRRAEATGMDVQERVRRFLAIWQQSSTADARWTADNDLLPKNHPRRAT